MLYHSFILPLLASLLSLSSCQDFTSTSSTSSSTSASSTTSATLAVSTDGACGDGTGFICLGSRWGDCCSPKGWCGKDASYCGAGCQTAFGNCTSIAGSSPGSSTKSISTDGSCGGSTGFICLGSTFGDCCSEKGYCGGNSSYCSAGCQSDFGHCGDSSTNQTTQISIDGSCGESSGTTCLGSEFGDCCSPKGWCGGNSSYCDAGCQSEFGKCSAALSSTNSATSPTSATAEPAASATSSAANLPIPSVQTTGFKAGIATASSIAFLALLALAILLFRRRRRRNNHNSDNMCPHKSAADSVEAPSGSDVSTPSHTNPYAKTYPSELSTVGYHQELPANEKRSLGTRIEERETGSGPNGYGGGRGGYDGRV